MGRAPVLEERGAAVPAHAPVDLLEVAATSRAGRDEVTLVRPLLEVEPPQVPRLLLAAERTAKAREDPGAAADVAGQASAAILDHLGVAGRRSAEGTDADRPV